MMNEISNIEQSLPENIEDLARFALIGREKLTAVRAEINAIKKVGLAKEVLEQKKAEAQDIAELVTMAEVKIGKMLKDIPKASGGDHGNQYTSGKFFPRENFANDDSDAEAEQAKMDVVKELGFTPKQTFQFQRMADHEDIVHDAMTEARINDDIVSRSQVLKKIDEAEHKPHVSFNSGNNEWYTPAEIIESARDVMGGIDLDPASSDIANEVVKADMYYTADNNGLDKEWRGNVWMNPPYSADLCGAFIDKLTEEREHISQAIVLVNNATETSWFLKLIPFTSAICFPKGRIRFYMPGGNIGSPLQGQAILYIGNSARRFVERFSEIGWCAYPDDIHRQ